VGHAAAVLHVFPKRPEDSKLHGRRMHTQCMLFCMVFTLLFFKTILQKLILKFLIKFTFSNTKEEKFET
jgi:hypothetical protein